MNSRGHALAETFAHLKNAHVAYICDVDMRAIARTVQAVEVVQSRRPTGLEDFRKALDDPSLDVVVIATPDHWHAPAAILALDAGKHVYVEKPCSHNAAEGEMLIAATRRKKKICQMGNQRRSWSKIKEAISRLQGGLIGPLHYVRCWYANARRPIGVGRPAPEWLNWELWQGPVPRVFYRDNVFHYNWHWFWHWATSEAGNNGVHSLNLARWGIGDDYPVRVTSAGGRYPYATIYENIELPMLFNGRSGKRRRERVFELLEMVALVDWRNHRPSELSGGQQQRVAIARALANDPSMITADEPTGNLDSKTGEEIMGLFVKLQEEGRTMLMVIHDNNIAAYSQRTIRLLDGRIV